VPAKVDVDQCLGYGVCVEECPVGAISLNDVASVNEALCTDRGACVDVCPDRDSLE